MFTDMLSSPSNTREYVKNILNSVYFINLNTQHKCFLLTTDSWLDINIQYDNTMRCLVFCGRLETLFHE